MDFLNKYFAQIRELFEGMTPGARVTSALLLAVTVASLGYLFTSGFTPGGDVFLLDNQAFTSDELRPMLAAFATDGLPAPEIVGGKIRVARGKETAYVAALAKAGAMPKNSGAILGSAVKESSTFEDKTKFQAREKIALQEYLGGIIGKMSGIERATVVYDVEVKPGLRREREVTASVSVKPIGSLPLEESQVQAITQYVAGAVAGLKVEKVVVLDNNTGRTFRGSASDSLAGGGSSVERKQREWEVYYQSEIERLLGYIHGVTVKSTVGLTPEERWSTTRTTYDKDSSVSVSMSEKKTSRDYTGESKGGRPGYVAQQNTARSLGTTESKGAEENEKTSEMVESKLPAGERTEKEYAAHMIERVAVAITVPTSWFSKIWHKRNPTPPGEDPQEPPAGDIDKIRTEEIANIKAIVAGALPTTDGVTDPTQLVTVTALEDIIPAPIPEPTMTENAGSWFAQNWSTVGLILLGLVSLLMLRSMIRSTPSGRDLEVAGLEQSSSESGEDEEGDGDEEPRKIAFSGTGASLQDELTELVATDPETAANILKNWIGSGVGAK